jgi:hypothetical protein
MLKITHTSGFFSCYTIRLVEIILFFNKNKAMPLSIDSSEQFLFYKPENNAKDITQLFIKETDCKIPYAEPVYLTSEEGDPQFTDYKKIDFPQILPFIKKYFDTSDIVNNNIKLIETKYNIDYENICVLFYRGLAKYIETNLPTFDDYIYKAREILIINPKTIFLIQSDETDFIDRMRIEFPNNIIFNDVITHVYKERMDYEWLPNSEHSLSANKRRMHSILFLSIVKIMAKSKNVICCSGNISLWICLFRGNMNGVFQYLSHKKTMFGKPNPQYKHLDVNWL